MRSSDQKPAGGGLMMVPVVSNYGECKHCGYTGPLHQFKSKGVCHSCSLAIRTGAPVTPDPTHPKQQKEAMKAVENLLRRTRTPDVPTVGQLVNEMMEQFGGTTEFARSWHTAIMTAKLEDPGSAKVLRAHEQLSKLVTDANRIKIQDKPVSDMSDEEIRAEMLRVINEEMSQGRIAAD